MSRTYNNVLRGATHLPLTLLNHERTPDIMTSPARAAANAANAQLSSGPRTAEGKARSSRNALKHGLTSQDLIVREDERDEFNHFQADLQKELGPEGAVEMLTFNQLLRAGWNMHRFQRLEAGLMVDGLDPLLDESSAKTLDRLHRYHGQAERSYYRHLRELRVLQTNRALRCLKMDEEEEELVPTLVSYNDLAKRTHAEVQAEAFDIAAKMMNFENAVLINTCRRILLQNEPTAAPPARENAA